MVHTHGEGGDDGECKNREGCILGHDLQKVASPRLAQIAVKDCVDVDHGVGNDDLQEPAEQPADAAGEDYGAGRGDVCVRAFFAEVEGRVVAAMDGGGMSVVGGFGQGREGVSGKTAPHCPDYGNEGHKEGEAVREIRACIEVAPHLFRGSKLWKPLFFSVCPSWDHDDDNEECDDVEGRPYGVEPR